MKINWELVKDKEPAEVDPEEPEKYWDNLKHYCFYCKKVSVFYRCGICGKRYCSEHCHWDNESTWEAPGRPDYAVCYHCC